MTRRQAIGASVWTVMLMQLFVVADPATGQTQSPPTNSQRVVEMQQYFAQITRLHEALIRGDLKALPEPASRLAAIKTPVAFPEKGAPFVEAIRQAARRVGTATDLRMAATDVVTLAGQCAACHRAVGIFPSPASQLRPNLPSVVGHMIEHQRAADDMLQGLVMPSASRWQEAADRLENLSLEREKWPPNRRLTEQARKADVAVHALPDRARAATSDSARGVVYVDLVTTCASCHTLGKGAWGPRSPR